MPVEVICLYENTIFHDWHFFWGRISQSFVDGMSLKSKSFAKVHYVHKTFETLKLNIGFLSQGWICLHRESLVQLEDVWHYVDSKDSTKHKLFGMLQALYLLMIVPKMSLLLQLKHCDYVISRQCACVTSSLHYVQYPNRERCTLIFPLSFLEQDAVQLIHLTQHSWHYHIHCLSMYRLM